MSPIIVRMVLDTCKNLEEAVDLLKAVPHAACYNFSVGDSQGDVAVVEGSPEGVMVRRDEEAMTCTNHFVEMYQFNRENAMNSERRKEVLAGSLDSSGDLFDIFASPGKGLFYQNYKEFFGTLHTFSYDFSERMVKTKVAQSPVTLDFDIDDLTNDRDLPVSCLKGYIEDIG